MSGVKVVGGWEHRYVLPIVGVNGHFHRSRYLEIPGRPAILDSLSRPVTLPGMGMAISPRGDMLKNCVPLYARTHRVGNQLNFRGQACPSDRDTSMSRIDRRSSEGRFRLQSRLIPGSVRRAHSDVSQWADEFTGQSAVVICSDGATLSQGTAAWLRHAGVAADVLEGGFESWTKAALPRLTASKIPPLDGQGRSVWVTRARPKVDRIACPG